MMGPRAADEYLSDNASNFADDLRLTEQEKGIFKEMNYDLCEMNFSGSDSESSMITSNSNHINKPFVVIDNNLDKENIRCNDSTLDDEPSVLNISFPLVLHDFETLSIYEDNPNLNTSLPSVSSHGYSPTTNTNKNVGEEEIPCIGMFQVNDTESKKQTQRESIAVRGDLEQKLPKHLYPSAADSKKTYYCAWCEKYIQKYARHIQDVHCDKPEVKELLDQGLAPKQKRLLISKLRNSHTFSHNYKPSGTENNKEFLVSRRSNRNKPLVSSESYTACDRCQAVLRISNIRHHYSRCNDEHSKSNKGRLANSRRNLMKLHPYANTAMKDRILPYMVDDQFKKKLLNDELLILFANRLTECHPREEDELNIRSKLRTVGKFLWHAENINPRMKNLATLAVPRNIKVCVQATYAACGANESLTDMRAPSTAKAIGTVLKHVAEFLCRLFVEREDNDRKKLAKDFSKLLIGEFEIINRRAETVYRERRRLKECVIPSTSDISVFIQFLELSRKMWFDNLSANFSQIAWRKLGETTLLLVQCLNRRRQGEVSKMKITYYKSHKGINNDRDVMDSLTEQEKKVANTYVRFVLSAKRDNDDVVLLKKELVDSIELFLSFRGMAGVKDTNPYVFGIPSTDTRNRYMKAYMLMSEYANMSGVKRPKTIRGTMLRKQIATKCADDEITQAEAGDLARYLGHTEKIHRAYYRQRATRDILCVSQLLEAANVPKNMPSHTNDTTPDDLNHNTSKSNVVNNTFSVSFSEPPSPESLEVSMTPGNEMRTKQLKSRSNNIQGRKRTISSESETELENLPVIKRKIKRTRWSVAEVNLIKTAFNSHLEHKTYPSKYAIEEVLNEHSHIFQERTYHQVKAWMLNSYVKNKK